MSYDPLSLFPTPYDTYSPDDAAEIQADICESCGQPIYVGEEYYDISGCAYCETCINNARREADA